MSKVTMSDRKRPRSFSYIQSVEVHDIRPLPINGSRIGIEIVVGKKIHKTSTFKIQFEVTPTWCVGLALDDLEPSTLVRFEIYQCSKTPLMPKKSLGWAERSVIDLLSSSDTAVHLMNHASLSSAICSLQIVCSDDIRRINEGNVSVTLPLTPHHKTGQLLNTVSSIKDMIDALASAYPAAKFAWSIVSVGINILNSQVVTNEVIKDLYATMLSTYEQASQDELWNEQDHLQSVYDSLFKHTIECSIFIKGYMQRGAGRMFTMNLMDKAKEFQEGFEDLQDQLLPGITKETLFVTPELREEIEDTSMQELLRDLCPPTVLKAKSKCMEGTRTEIINDLMSWITQCSGGVLWCNGIAGTGKSSIVGTLHELLTLHASKRNRLAAFIRYDRTEYQNTSHLITSIAYSLGLFDNRISGAISQVLQKNQSVLGFPESSAKEQFRILIQDPLKSLPELANEG
ncbi:hypothetical protein ARMGADRAFT_1084071, partial [Armillaria gallica]